MVLNPFLSAALRMRECVRRGRKSALSAVALSGRRERVAFEVEEEEELEEEEEEEEEGL